MFQIFYKNYPHNSLYMHRCATYYDLAMLLFGSSGLKRGT